MSHAGRPRLMTGAEALVRTLKQHGVTTVFGYPGAHTVPIYEALRRERGVRHVLVRHEQGAAFMADGYARSSGRVGVCLTTAGPGATNTATAVAEALSDCVPIVVLTAQVDTTARGKGAYHELDLRDFFEPITKWNAAAERAEHIPLLVAEAFFHCRSGRPGPAQLELPRDVLAAECRPTFPEPRDIVRPPVSEEEANAIAQRLSAARRPALLAGGGVVSADACAEFVALTETLKAPAATTQMGRGAIPDSHPLALGQSNTSRVQHVFGQADLVLAVGCRFAEVSTRGWSLPAPNLIHIDVDPRAFHPSYPAQMQVVADAKRALAAIVETLRRRRTDVSSEWQPSEMVVAQTGSEWPHDAVIECIQAAFNDATVFGLDVTILTYRLLTRRRVQRPRTMLYPAAYIAMGYGLPAAIGAKVAWPERPVACLAGDGGFAMTLQELATAVRLGVPLPILVYNDGCLQSIKRAHSAAYPGRSFEVELNNPDFVALARAFGGDGRRVADVSDLPAALEQAKASDGVFLVEVLAGAEQS